MKKIKLILTLALLSTGIYAQTADSARNPQNTQKPQASQTLTARQICDASMEQGSPQKALAYLEKQIENATRPEDKRALYAYLGNLQEMLSMYSEAQRSYASAAGIAAGDAPGLPKKSSEALVIDAVRCALCAGESETALSYLNSAVRNSKSEKIQAQIKLYEQWARLSIAQNLSQTMEAEAMLKVYLTLSSMDYVKAEILLTLWYITGEKTYSDQLLQNYSLTSEAAIVSGKIQILPTPFWFFLPRKSLLEEAMKETKALSQEKMDDKEIREVSKENVQASAKDEDKKESPAVQEPQSAQETKVETKTERNADKKEEMAPSTAKAEKEDLENNSSSQEKIQTEKLPKLQLGLFRDKNNAISFLERVQKEGFAPYIQEEVRQSGTVYYLVIVDENKEKNMGLKLKSAGFESYPIY